MSICILRPDPQRFPPATSVAAYKASQWPPGGLEAGAAPVGAAVETVSVAADGSLVFVTLTDDDYVAREAGGKFLRFRADLPPASALPPLQAKIDTAASGDTTIVPAVPGRIIIVTAWSLIAAAGVSATWKSGASNALGGARSFPANGGTAIGEGANGVLITRPGEALVLNLGAAIAVGGEVTYVVPR